MQIVERLETALPDMQPINRKIASYILENAQGVAFSSIYEQSAAIGVSNATLVRFARSLGFGGWAELKRTIQEEIKQRLSPIEKVALSGLDALPSGAQLEQLCENEIGNLKKTLEALSLADLQAMVEGVAAAGRIFLCGFGVTRHVIGILEHALSCTQSKGVTALTGAVSDFSPKLRALEEGDALFLLTFPPYSREALHVAAEAKDRGARLFLFTDSPRCPAYRLADAAVRCENNSLLLTNSFVGLIAVVQIFVNLLFLSDKALAVSRLGEVLALEGRGYARLSGEPDGE